MKNTPSFSCCKILMTLCAVLTVTVSERSSHAATEPAPSLESWHVGVAGVRVFGESDFFILQFPEPPIASASSGLMGFAPVPRNSSGRLDFSSPQAFAYESFLEQRQADTLQQASAILGRPLNARFTFRHAFNGIAARIAAEEVDLLHAAGLIVHAEPLMMYPLLTDAGPGWIGSPEVWSGTALGGGGTLGEGVVVGIIDSGINTGHPSFAAVTEDGFVHSNPLGSGNFIGWCNPGVGTVTDTCNDKLIGTWEFLQGVPGVPAGSFIPGGEDENGHGTHVAATVAGNPMVSNFPAAGNPAVSGVAPRANVIAYNTCFTDTQGRGLCPNVSTLAAINQAVADGVVDVINYSIGGGTQPWQEAISLAFLNAVDAGIFVSASAGNSGPGASTMGHLQPWVASVAAATHNRFFANASITVTDAGAPAELVRAGAIRSQGPAPAGNQGSLGFDPGNPLGCDAFPAGFFSGQIALVDRGVCGFAVKIENAAAAGAVGVIVGNNDPAPPGAMGGTGGITVPAVMVSRAAAQALRAYASTAGEVTVRIDPENPNFTALDDSLGDIVTSFSSRGPNPFNITKPSVTAPGSQILAAVAAGDGSGAPRFDLYSGTSMASPHNAGAAALLRALRPSWLPSEIQSALMLTARTAILANNGGAGIQPATIFAEGAGSIRVNRAAATPLVLRETTLNFFLANPATGGDPRTLNLAGLSDDNCIQSCSFVRSFRSVADGPRSFELRLTADSDLTASFSPPRFTILPGQIQSVLIEISAGEGTDEWKFGQVTLTPVDDLDSIFRDRFSLSSLFPDAPLSLPVSIIATGAVIDVDETPIVVSAPALSSAAVALEIANLGGGPLLWQANAAPFVPGAELVRQAGSTGNGIISTFVNTLSAGAYSADVFDVSAPTALATLRFDGFVNNGSLATGTTGVRMYLYADAGGVPAGHPEDGLDNELWSVRVANPSPGLSLADDIIVLDLLQAGLAPPALAPGRYWVSVAPERSGPQWNWFNATTGGSAGNAQLVGPSVFNPPIPNWVAINTLTNSALFTNLSFAINSAASCGAPWLTVSPTSGTVGPGAEPTPLALQFATAGLVPGIYSTHLCLSSNDARMPLTLVPVSFEVTAGTEAFAVFGFDGFGDLIEATEAIASVNVQAFNIDPATPIRYRLVLTDADGEGIAGQAFSRCSDGPSCLDRQAEPLTDAEGETFFGLPAGVAAGSAGILGAGGETTWFAFAPIQAGGQTLKVEILDVSDAANPVLIAAQETSFVVEESRALVQIAHLAPFAPTRAATAVNILVNGQTAISNVEFGDSTGYLPIPVPPPSANVLIEVVPVGETEAVITRTVTLEPDANYSVLAVGDGGNQDLALIAMADDLSPPANGNFHLRLGHAAAFASGPATADIRLADGTEILSAVDFGQASAFLPQPEGSYDLIITAPGGTPVLIDPIALNLAAGTRISAFAVGGGVHDEPLGVFAWEPDAPGVFLPLNQADAQDAVVDFSNSPSPDLACALANIPSMPTANFPLAPYAHVNGLAWDTLLETQGGAQGSWAEEAAILIGSSSARAQILLQPGSAAPRPTVGPERFAGSVPNLSALGLDFALDADGLLHLSFCETFLDGLEPNAIWRSPSTLTINPGMAAPPDGYPGSAAAMSRADSLGASSRRSP